MEQGRWQWDAFDHREEVLATRPSVVGRCLPVGSWRTELLTADRHWAYARAWLYNELRRDE